MVQRWQKRSLNGRSVLTSPSLVATYGPTHAQHPSKTRDENWLSITISNPHFMKDIEKVAHNVVMPEDSSRLVLQAFSLYFRGASSLLRFMHL